MTRALVDEIQRNQDRLVLADQPKPCFIAYNVRDLVFERLHGIRGELRPLEHRRMRQLSVRLMVGNFHLNDEHLIGGWSYRDTLFEGLEDLPIEADYLGLRRALWLATDKAYKIALEQYAKKKASLQSQQAEAKRSGQDDFSVAEPVRAELPPISSTYDRGYWQETVRFISAVFKNYPSINLSHVEFSLYRGDEYIVNSEGTRIVQPFSLAMIEATAFSQTQDGKPLWDRIQIPTSRVEDLPDRTALTKAIEELAQRIVDLGRAPDLGKSYFGPVLIADEAIADLVAQSLFGYKDGLLASFFPVFTNKWEAQYYQKEQRNELEERLNSRILPRGTSIKALPGLDRYMGLPVLGSYRYDEEGVPAQEVTLVNDGMLRAFLSDRSHTSSAPVSNGHCRPVICLCGPARYDLGPSVISLSSNAGKDYSTLRKTLRQLGSQEGLPAVLVVRKFAPPIELLPDELNAFANESSQNEQLSGQSVVAVLVSVADGKERPVGPLTLSLPTLNILRRIAGMSKELVLHNRFHLLGDTRFGMPASFILPQAILFEDMVARDPAHGYLPQRPVTTNPYLVQNSGKSL
ncbi:MAG: hypothetical protein A2284_08745 [Deltaproteobacteria bacterium RIFOXYA12_FULL_61_11]|nr:MAG: hypothetical protein A2284_08745 [Deltaproteobacteria bacterium RIFOXYA12_FULL_61_11]